MATEVQTDRVFSERDVRAIVARYNHLVGGDPTYIKPLDEAIEKVGSSVIGEVVAPREAVDQLVVEAHRRGVAGYVDSLMRRVCGG